MEKGLGGFKMDFDCVEEEIVMFWILLRENDILVLEFLFCVSGSYEEWVVFVMLVFFEKVYKGL